MVRYELILTRAPKLAVKELEARLGNLPKELSLGSMQRALEKPELLPLAVAWGNSRKNLLVVQRRIVIMSGAADVIDHASGLRRVLTDCSDVLLAPWRAHANDAAGSGDARSSAQAWAWSAVVLLGGASAALWWRGTGLALPPWVQAAAPRMAGFLSGVLLAQGLRVGVLGLRSGRRRLFASLCLVASLLGLTEAVRRSHEHGILTRALAIGSKLTTHEPPKPNMKPFTALLVELARRQQRQELEKAMHEISGSTSTTPGAEPAAEQAPNQPELTSAAGAAAAPTQLASAGTEAPIAAAQPPATRTANPRAPTQQARAGAEAPLAAASQPATRRTGRPESSASSPQPAPKLQKTAAHEYTLEAWRSVSDVNPIHGAAGLSLSLLTFALGFWLGRRRRSGAAAAASSGQRAAGQAVPEPDGAKPVPTELQPSAAGALLLSAAGSAAVQSETAEHVRPLAAAPPPLPAAGHAAQFENTERTRPLAAATSPLSAAAHAAQLENTERTRPLAAASSPLSVAAHAAQLEDTERARPLAAAPSPLSAAGHAAQFEDTESVRPFAAAPSPLSAAGHAPRAQNMAHEAPLATVPLPLPAAGHAPQTENAERELPDPLHATPSNDTSEALAAADAKPVASTRKLGQQLGAPKRFAIQEERVAPRKRDARRDD